MGRDKASLPAGDSSLIEHLVRRLSPVVDEVIIAGSRLTKPIEGVLMVEDRYPGRGPLAGMHAGLLAVRGARAWVVGCDLPDVEPRLAELLGRLADGYDAAVPRIGSEAEGVCAVYDPALAPRIEAMLDAGGRSVKIFLADCRVRWVSADEVRRVDPELRSFRNINTPDEYEAWLRTQSTAR